MKKHVVKLRMKATYEATLEIEADSIMEAYDKAQETVKTGAVQAAFVAAGQLRIVSVSEAIEE